MFSSARLEALAAVCDTGSFEQAALRLHLTPSAVSFQIKQIEAQTRLITAAEMDLEKPGE